jgi:hypothetical protein
MRTKGFDFRGATSLRWLIKASTLSCTAAIGCAVLRNNGLTRAGLLKPSFLCSLKKA